MIYKYIRAWVFYLVINNILFINFINSQSDYKTSAYGVKDGLSSELCRSIYKDKKGFLWISTDKGLNRFDGNSFYTFKHRPYDTNSIANNSCNVMFEDSKERFWVNTDDGLSFFDREKQTFRNFYPDTTVMSTLGISYTDMAEDHEGKIWIGGYYDVLIFDPSTEKFKKSGWYDFALESGVIKSEKRNSITQSIKKKSDTELWLMTVYGLFSVHTPTNTFTYHPNLNIDDYFAFVIRYIDDNGVLWIATYDQCFYTYDPEKKLWTHYNCPQRNKSFSNHISSINKFDENQLLMTRTDSIYLFNVYTKRFKGAKWNYEEANLKNTSFTQTLFSKENVYITKSGDKPFIHLVKSNSSVKKIKIPLPQQYVNNHSYISSSGKIISGDWDKNEVLVCDSLKCINLMDNNGNTKLGNLQLSFTSNSGQQFFSTSKYVYSWSESDYKVNLLNVTEKYLNKSQTEFRNFVEDKDGNVYVRERNKGIFINKKGNIDLSFFECGIKGNNFSALYYDKLTNKLWLAKEKGGLYVIDPKTRIFKNYSLFTLSKSEKGFIYDISGDSRGNVFLLISNRGFVRINSEEMIPKIYTVEDGLISDAVKYGLVLNNEFFYFTTESGLMAFDYVRERFYSFENEAASKLFTYRIFLNKQGNITQNLYPDQVLSFETKNINNYQSKSKIYLKEVKLFGKIIPNDTLFKFNYSQNNLVFSFGNLGSEGLNSLYYQYRINGQVWQSLENNSISLYDLSPGNYIVQVGNKFDSKSIFSIKIIITPPWWRTSWFYGLVFSLLALLIYFAYKKRIANIRKEEAEKNQLNQKIAEIEMTALRAQMNPHFIFNCLNSINRFILVNDSDAASDYLTKFSRLIRMILDGSRENFIPMDRELDALKLYIEMESMRFQNSFDWKISVDDDVNLYEILVPPLLLQPYVENAIWHGLMQSSVDHIKKLDVKITNLGNGTSIEILDNGIGRVKAKQLKSKTGDNHKSHGITLTEERLMLMQKMTGINSQIIIEDLFDIQKIGIGTKVTIILKQI